MAGKIRRIAVLTIFALAAGCATVSGIGLIELKQSANKAYAAGDMAKARTKYEDLVSRAPNDAHSWFRLGNIFARGGQLEEALAAYEKTVALEPGFAPAWRNIAVIRFQQGQRALIISQAKLENGHPLKESNQRLLDSITRALDDGKTGEIER